MHVFIYCLKLAPYWQIFEFVFYTHTSPPALRALRHQSHNHITHIHALRNCVFFRGVYNLRIFDIHTHTYTLATHISNPYHTHTHTIHGTHVQTYIHTFTPPILRHLRHHTTHTWASELRFSFPQRGADHNLRILWRYYILVLTHTHTFRIIARAPTYHNTTHTAKLQNPSSSRHHTTHTWASELRFYFLVEERSRSQLTNLVEILYPSTHTFRIEIIIPTQSLFVCCNTQSNPSQTLLQSYNLLLKFKLVA